MSLREQTRRLLLITASIMFPMFVGATSAQKTHKLHHPKRVERVQVELMEKQWRDAMMSGDVTIMDKLLADDYLGVTAGGDLVTKSQQLDRMRARELIVTRLDIAEVKLKLIGKIAIVTSLAEIETTTDGKPMQGEFRTTRVYQQVPSGSWKLTSFESTRVAPRFRTAQVANSPSGPN